MSGPITPHKDPRSDWRPDSNPIYDKTNDAIESSTKPVVEAVHKQTEQGGWQGKIDRLDSKGDTARSRTMLDGELDIGVLNLIPGGAAAKAALKATKVLDINLDLAVKGQSAHLIDVTRDSNAADSTYTVRYTKMSQGGLGAELGLPLGGTVMGSKGVMGLGGTLNGFVRADGYVGTANTVEFRFNTKEEAARAAASMEKLAAADMVDDGVQAALLTGSAPGQPHAPLINTLGQTYEGSKNNFANPMSEYGEVNPGLRRAAGVSDEEMSFLADHITAQEVSVMGGGRGAVEGRLTADGKFNLPSGSKVKLPGLELKTGSAIVPHVYRNTSYTRRVEYPTDVSKGRIVDSFNSYDQLSAKWRHVKNVGLNFLGQSGSGGATVTGQQRADDNYELAIMNSSVSFQQDIPAGTRVDLGYLAGKPPAFDKPATVDFSLMTPTGRDGLGLARTLNPLDLSGRGQAPDGQQRVDMNRLHMRYQVDGAAGLAMAGSMPVTGSGAGLLGQGLRQGDFIEYQRDTVKRDGNNTTQTLRAGLAGVVAVEGSLTKYGGVDDYDTAAAPVPPKPPPPPPPPPPPTPPASTGHYQVQPYEGVNVRSSPTTQGDNKVAIVQMGSFLDGTGEKKQDAQGQTWVKVKGRDQDDKMVEGWVRGDLMKSYDPRLGNNDASGRVNPQREHRGQPKIVVKQDDNLWNLARQYNQDFNRLLAANPHLLDPNVIFKGDSVYLPGR